MKSGTSIPVERPPRTSLSMGGGILNFVNSVDMGQKGRISESGGRVFGEVFHVADDNFFRVNLQHFSIRFQKIF